MSDSDKLDLRHIPSRTVTPDARVEEPAAKLGHGTAAARDYLDAAGDDDDGPPPG
jgi:hypothetical protein